MRPVHVSGRLERASVGSWMAQYARYVAASSDALSILCTHTEGHTIYMGRDKHENEELIRYGFLEDIWSALRALVPACSID